MSEYWKSTPKYWCKHCTIYVKDTPFERKQHENTGKHQGNLKRFLRGIQNDHERTERDKQKAKSEVERLNRVVGSAGAGGTAPTAVTKETLTSTQAALTRRAAPSTLSASDQQRQWAQLADMGIRVPDKFGAEMAQVGEWQSIAPQSTEDLAADEKLNVGVRKRKYENQEEEEEEEEEDDAVGEGLNVKESTKPRGWGSTTKRYPGQDQSDLDSLLSAPIIKRQHDAPAIPKSELHESIDARRNNSATEPAGMQAQSTSVINGGTCATAAETQPLDSDVNVKNESAEQATPLPAEVAAPVFKKRKSKAKT